MSKVRKITEEDVQQAAHRLLKKIPFKNTPFSVAGVPRGGIPAAYALAAASKGRVSVAHRPEDADFIVDDLIDSGKTRALMMSKYLTPFGALFAKSDGETGSPHRDYLFGTETAPDEWLVFPWEGSLEQSAEDIPRRLLQLIGEDPDRQGLIETPVRFVKAWREITSGYRVDPKSVLKSFEDGAENCDEMVIERNIPVYSNCEHHLVPFFGAAHVAYIPRGKVVGLSKIPRLVNVFAKRLQVQERLTNQIADALWTHLNPNGVAVVLECRHLCMEMRGVERIGTVTSTSALRGLLKESEARAEFFSLIRR